MEVGKAGFGGGQGGFFFAEGEADLLGAVLRVVVEAGAGDAGYTDVFDQIFGEGDVARGGGIIGFVEMETGDVRHDVVGAAGFVNGEAGGGEDFQEALALGGIVGGQLVVVGLRRFEREGAGLLQRSGRANSQKIVDLADGLRGFRRGDGPADTPTGDAVSLGHAVDDDGVVAHAVQPRHGDVLGAIVDDVLVDFVGNAVGVPAHAEIADEFEFGAGENFAGGIVGRVQDDGLGVRA